MAMVAFAPAARADPGTCGNCPIPWPPPQITYAPCSQLGPIDWWSLNNPAPFVGGGVRYINISATPTLDVAYGRFIENPTDQNITGNWTASLARTVTITSTFGLTLTGGRADPQKLMLSVQLAVGIQTTVSHTTTIGVGASAEVPPHSTMLGEYGLQSLDVVMDVQVMSMLADRVTCAFVATNVTRHTAHIPTINEGWRFTRS